ncbi:uncharacterized protein PV09_06264 [Verruconis gallopava]|uniref:Chromatin modification-related protein n=1 Tax=Verruconis gallopava TaxID=253628 RepID=A0A0D2ATI5_9PEZI|nr:uncharacterized protein PV09_06264 [Verruconis gallopava]KIW02454.1 hypothetical protein PV09_06264 [Verruconis gallopava]
MATAPGRRQSARQVVRTTRPQNYYARNFSGRNLADETPANNDAQPGFFPAIQHFTDAIDALPKEIIRHFSMLKEVEAKLHAPDEQVRRLAAAIIDLPPVTRNKPPPHAYFPSLSARNSVDGSRHGSVVGNSASDGTFNDSDDVADRERQALFYNLNVNIATMAPALDEKIAVLATANQQLQRQLDRMMSSYLHIPEEISDEARLGNPKHWAYVTDKETKKAPERSRREVATTNTLAAAAAAVEGEFASRSEARREAVAARKSRTQQIDSDFDDRPAPRKGPNKAKKTAEDPKSVGLGISNGVTGPNKRKKVAAAVPMERSGSSALGNTSRANQASPRETPDVAPKKRSKPGPAPKKRVVGGASPYLTSSPVIGTFAAKETSTRPGQVRGRQNSTANSTQLTTIENKPTRPPSSQSNKPTNGTSSLSAHEQSQLNAVAGAEGAEGSKLLLDQSKPMKSEDADVNDDVSMPDADAPAPLVVTRAGRASKTATPMSSTFPELGSRSRSVRNNKDNNGSHASSESGERSRRKKGAGSAATSTRADTDIAADEASDLVDEGEIDDAEMDDGDMDGAEEDANEAKYCYCNDVSYGEMVACDNENCEREWFHLKCAGLSRAPDENTKWYCDECKMTMKESSKRSRPVSRRE